eukprot:1159235-Pelagomonas_calceolata.AAC.11
MMLAANPTVQQGSHLHAHKVVAQEPEASLVGMGLCSKHLPDTLKKEASDDHTGKKSETGFVVEIPWAHMTNLGLAACRK